MKINKEKCQLFFKKFLPFFLIFFVSMMLGIFVGYFANPKCGTVREKTQYIISGIRELLSQEEQIEIIKQCEECICEECTTEEKEEKIDDDCPVRVDVSGAVRNPGVYCFEEGSVIMDAVTRAGGFLADYGYKYIYRKINLAEEMVSNEKIYFPFKEDLVCELLSFSTEVEEEVVVLYPKEDDSEQEEENTSEESESSDCISINSASIEELDELNGIGEATAQKIIDGRPYDSLEDLLDVKGIGDATFDKIKDDICL
ncbi:hypothetical protein GYA44_03435 [Candidatus Microgenomates bacterium]|jgi:competence protein ComEA|nr:hypothetical protein [Candidatus Microgenomates bacterium]